MRHISSESVESQLSNGASFAWLAGNDMVADASFVGSDCFC